MKNYVDKDLHYDEPRILEIVFDNEEMEEAFISCMIYGYEVMRNNATTYPKLLEAACYIDKIFIESLKFEEYKEISNEVSTIIGF